MIGIAALVAGLVVGLILQPTAPGWLEPYLPIAIVAALDAVFGAARAALDGIFNDRVFVVSFISNVLVAALIVFLGDKLGVGTQLSTAVVVVLGHPHLQQRRRDPPPRLQGLIAAMSRARCRAPTAGCGWSGLLLLALLGFGLAASVRSQRSASQLATARPNDLVRILDDLDARASLLRTQITELQNTPVAPVRQRLRRGGAGRGAQADRRTSASWPAPSRRRARASS